MNENIKTNLQEIQDLLRNTADTSKIGIYTILRGLKGGELFSDSVYEHLLKAAELDMFRVWRNVYVNKSFKYERTTDFVEARILEYFRNEEHLLEEEAEEVLEYIRVLAASLTMQTLQNKTKPENKKAETQEAATEKSRTFNMDFDTEDTCTEDLNTENRYIRRPYPGYSHVRHPRGKSRYIRRRKYCQRKWIAVTVLAVTVSGLAVTAAYLKGKADGKNSH